MKKIKLFALCAIVAGVITSCQKDEITNEIQPESVITKEQKLAILDAGLNPERAEITTVNDLGAGEQTVIQVDDIMLKLDALAQGKYALGDGENNTKQYRSRNVVRANSTINITGWNSGSAALSSTMRRGLELAVDNYNRININLNFVLRFGTDEGDDVDMVVYNNGLPGGGGSAGFPEDAKPNKYIRINDGTTALGINACEHVIGHEMGHSIGLRHTNYARRNCSDQNNEGDAGVGAIHIPGTPTQNQTGQQGLDNDSLMIACFSRDTDGEFSNFDEIALRFIYRVR